jgi:membrane protein
MRSDGNNRGRGANKAGDIPAKGWKDSLLRVKKGIRDDSLSLLAAGMSYFALLAFVPAISSVVLIYAWISDPSQIAAQIEMAGDVIPVEIRNTLNEQLSTLSSEASGTLGFGAIGSLLFALWSASKGSKAVIESLNIIYDEEEKRGFIKLNIFAIGMTAFAAIMAIAAIGVIVGVPIVMNFVELGRGTQIMGSIISWVILLGLFSVFLAFAYRFGPNRSKAKWTWVSRGAVTASILWALVSLGFSYYASRFGEFNKAYGSMGAVVVLMMWFYLSSFVILLGGELNAELEHQTMKDSTEGEPEPLGRRGAKKADTIGKSHQDSSNNNSHQSLH